MLVDDVVDESDENEATEVDTENDTEYDEDETGPKTQVQWSHYTSLKF